MFLSPLSLHIQTPFAVALYIMYPQTLPQGCKLLKEKFIHISMYCKEEERQDAQCADHETVEIVGLRD